MQEAGREHDTGMRQVRAKLQRTEAELRTAKQAAVQAAGRVQELEALNAKKDLQLDAAVQQVGAAAAAASACGWLLRQAMGGFLLPGSASRQCLLRTNRGRLQ